MSIQHIVGTLILLILPLRSVNYRHELEWIKIPRHVYEKYMRIALDAAIFGIVGLKSYVFNCAIFSLDSKRKSKKQK